MSMQDKTIRIVDWTGRDLYIGPYDSAEVDHILDQNRCICEDGCENCNDTGYLGDFHVEWIDQDNNELNVYEYINY